MTAARGSDLQALDTTVDVRCAAWRRAVPGVTELCRNAALAAFRSACDGCGKAEVGIVLADDELLRMLNREWRHTDAPTNVLAFPCDAPTEGRAGPTLLGDVVISWRTTEAEAARDGKALADHLQHLVVHGMLHLLGFDHETDEEGDRMEALETRILGELGVADPHSCVPDDRMTP